MDLAVVLDSPSRYMWWYVEIVTRAAFLDILCDGLIISGIGPLIDERSALIGIFFLTQWKCQLGVVVPCHSLSKSATITEIVWEEMALGIIVCQTCWRILISTARKLSSNLVSATSIFMPSRHKKIVLCPVTVLVGRVEVKSNWYASVVYEIEMSCNVHRRPNRFDTRGSGCKDNGQPWGCGGISKPKSTGCNHGCTSSQLLLLVQSVSK